jgi:cytochrome c556
MHYLTLSLTLPLITLLMPVMAEAAESASDQRQRLFEQIEDELDRINLRNPDWQRLQQQTRHLAAWGQELLTAFPPDSNNEGRARDRIWQEWPQFSQRLQDFSHRLQTLQQVAETEDKDALQQQLQTLDDTCHRCHRPYRSFW